jgi:hypothetical protein
MNEAEIKKELEELENLRFSQISMIEYWSKKLADTNQNIYNLEIDLVFEQAKQTNLKINP